MNNPVYVSDIDILILKMEKTGFSLSAHEGHLRVEGGKLSDNQRQYLQQHKTEILTYLANKEAANHLKRYTYRFSLKNNAGAGTYITDCPPDQAQQEILDKFIGREIESMDLVN